MFGNWNLKITFFKKKNKIAEDDQSLFVQSKSVHQLYKEAMKIIKPLVLA